MPKTFFLLWHHLNLRCWEMPARKDFLFQKVGVGWRGGGAAAGVRLQKCLTFLGKSYVTDSRKYHSNQPPPSSRPTLRGCEPSLFLCASSFWSEVRNGPDPSLLLSRCFARQPLRNAWKKTNSWGFGKEMLAGARVCKHTQCGREALLRWKLMHFLPSQRESVTL